MIFFVPRPLHSQECNQVKLAMQRISTMVAVAWLSLGAASSLLANDAGWPRTVDDGKNQIVIYQPQPDSLGLSALQ